MQPPHTHPGSIPSSNAWLKSAPKVSCVRLAGSTPSSNITREGAKTPLGVHSPDSVCVFVCVYVCMCVCVCIYKRMFLCVKLRVMCGECAICVCNSVPSQIINSHTSRRFDTHLCVCMCAWTFFWKEAREQGRKEGRERERAITKPTD